MRSGRDGSQADHDELAAWLADGYAPAFRTAYLILHNRADAEEAVQDAFLRAWRFRAAVPAGEGVRPWLYRVVVNACLTKLRTDRTRAGLTTGLHDLPTQWSSGPGGAEPEAAAVERETEEAVVAAIAALPEHLRVVVVLRYYGQLSEREIATVIHRRSGTVKSRMHEARARLGADPRLAVHAEVGAFAARTEAADD